MRRPICEPQSSAPVLPSLVAASLRYDAVLGHGVEVAGTYDLFLSYHRANAGIAWRLHDALEDIGLRVFIDNDEIHEFQSISSRLRVALANSKGLLALFSTTYPSRRACQFELTTAFLAALRMGDPQERVLVVNLEEGSEHIEPLELRNARFLPLTEAASDAAVRGVAASLKAHVAQLDGVLGDVGLSDTKQWYGRQQPPSSPFFVGRLKAMWDVHSKLHAGEFRAMTGVAGRPVVQVRGLGGVGKSLLVGEYALRFAAAYPAGIFWLSASDDVPDGQLTSAAREANRISQLRTLALRLGVSPTELTDPDAIELKLEEKLDGRGQPYLWIVDDVPSGLDRAELDRWLAPQHLGKTLLTTRSREYGALGSVVEPGPLTPAEAVDLLALHRSPSDSSEIEAAMGLAEDLGGHPLALQVAGAHLQDAAGRTPFADFRIELSDQSTDALEFAADLTDELPTSHEPSIAQTLLSTVATLGAEATDLLRLASVVAAAPIPSTFVDQVFAETDGLEDASARDRGLLARRAVQRASLSERAEDGSSHTIHPLVSRTIRYTDRSGEQRRDQLRTTALRILARKLEVDKADLLAGVADEFVPHARYLASDAAQPREVDLLHSLANYYYVRGSYAAAVELEERALDGRERLFGEEDMLTLASLNSLGAMLQALGDLDGALALQGRLLDHLDGLPPPMVITAVGNAALTLRDRGELNRARELQQKALDTAVQVFGESARETVDQMHALGPTLRRLGDLEGARRLQDRVLVLRRAAMGSRHPETIEAMNNLAVTLESQLKLEQARELQQEVVDAAQAVYGEHHPHTYSAMNSLGVTLHRLGETDQARSLMEQALAGQRAVLGESHPETIKVKTNLAALDQPATKVQLALERALRFTATPPSGTGPLESGDKT